MGRGRVRPGAGSELGLALSRVRLARRRLRWRNARSLATLLCPLPALLAALPLLRLSAPLPPFCPLSRLVASLVRWLVECLKRPLCSLWLLCKLNKSSFECKRTDSSGTNTATTHTHTVTHTHTHSHTGRMQKKAALRTSEHWMNVNVIVLQMKIDFWIVGTVRHSLPSYSPLLPLPLYKPTKWNQREFSGLRKREKAESIRSFNFNTKFKFERARERDSNKYMNISSLKRTAAASNCVCGKGRESGREREGVVLPAQKTVLCIFHAETKTAKNIRKSALASWQLRLFLCESSGEERERRARGRGRERRLPQSDGLQSGFELFKKCDCYLQNVQWIETRDAMKTSDDDGNSSQDSRGKK